jgi:CheY-like chemotaxis protein
LWVDDNVSLLELMEVGFASLPDTVRLVTRQSGQEGLAEARAHPPDLIVLDIMMPDMNGLEVLSRLKADPAHAWNSCFDRDRVSGSRGRGGGTGAVAYFLKPFRVPDILEKVREHLKIPTFESEIVEFPFQVILSNRGHLAPKKKIAPVPIAVIGGSGLYDIPGIEKVEERSS